jgi:RNA polymerase sigma-70 factor (ECF subfamily)
VIHGVAAVAENARPVPGSKLHPVLVNGAPGVIVTVRGRPFAILAFTVTRGRIVEIDAIGDPERVRRVAAAFLTDQ